ncbi:MAG: class II glutamine amidotransferase [bacterium]
MSASEVPVCELLAISARFPTTIHLSLDELARHGGDTGPHRDGWGVAYLQDGDALVLREPDAASESRLLACAKHTTLRSATVVAHIRHATQGPRMLRNTQPFARELGGRLHVFAHNGMLPGIEDDPRFSTRRFRRIGDTDSEHAFCALLDRIAPLWQHGAPSLEARIAEIGALAAALRVLGPANFIYTDGDAVFAHGHRRRDGSGAIRPPGLHFVCRTCTGDSDGVALAGVSVGHDAQQQVAVVASVPLSDERWEAIGEGELVVLREGRVALRSG